MINEKKLIERLKGTPALNNVLQGLIRIIEEQPRIGEWIPFKEREADEEERKVYGCDMMLTGELPDEDEDILVTYASGKVGSDAFLREGYECYLDSGAAFVTEAVAWMPFPEAYKK